MKAMNFFKALAPVAVMAFAAHSVQAHVNTAQGPKGGTAPTAAKAAGCSPSTHVNELDLNNVRARVETGGNVWMDRNLGRSAYEVPKTVDRSGPRAIFAGGLWMGGRDPGGNLKQAGVMFRQNGNDYWPGPLDTLGAAEVTPDVCRDFDRTWKVTLAQVEAHVAYYRCQNDPNCNAAEEYPDGYVTPLAFLEWPARGDVTKGQSITLAPFGTHPDVEPDGDYNPNRGDYPGYDLLDENDCKNRFKENPVPLYGDQTIWWVFNDKGNIHGETSGEPIGMEIRAQAFAFSTNDEVNNMTFYNYVLYNRGTLRLTNTFFGQYVDPDLGNALDDYVGCDVQRGLGYCYNGDNNDETTSSGIGYGVQPPAVGVDFFEGPFQDTDGVDNPLTDDCFAAVAGGGIVYGGIGMGYGDGVADNERYGMRAFLYYINGTIGTGPSAPSATTDPDSNSPIHFYNFLNGVWKDNTPMTYGGTGYDPANPGAVRTSYMFPGTSDPLGWATSCVPQSSLWTEETAGNSPSDRRFIQSSGPFVLEPGAYNNITVGVVWGRAPAGGPYASVGVVKRADDKAQALFDNCFRVLDGPDAPIVEVQELDREIILFLTYPDFGSNNRSGSYVELDPTIPETRPGPVVTVNDTVYDQHGNQIIQEVQVPGPALPNDRFYRFQGYMVYQVANAEVGPDQLNDVNVARLIAQVDKRDGINRLVNWPLNEAIGLPTPTEMVNGSDTGIVHSFRILEDKFASGADPRLVNFKTYHFMAIAYGSNTYMEYNPFSREGQAFPFLPGRRSAAGGSIRSYAAIPHKPAPEANGTVQNAEYGDQFPVTRIEGQGNGGAVLAMTIDTENAIMSGSPWQQSELVYRTGFGPLKVSVVDPLKVPAGKFELWFKDNTTRPSPTASAASGNGYTQLDDAYWELVRLSDNPTSKDTVRSLAALGVGYDQLVLDWGLGVNITQAYFTPRTVSSSADQQMTRFLGATIEPQNSWYAGIPDTEGESEQNWIRSGIVTEDVTYLDFGDPDQEYESILGGTWAPWPVVGRSAQQPSALGASTTAQAAAQFKFSDLPSIQFVFTPDRSKWTRANVLETHDTPANTYPTGTVKLTNRPVPSVDKSGIPSGSPGCNEAEATLTSATGMGWFPGYAIDMETGERLNISFGEDSFLGGTRGRDMLWNPTDTLANAFGEPILGGGHWIYVHANRRRTATNADQVPMYDAGATFHAANQGTSTARIRAWRSIAWVGSGLLAPGTQLRAPQDGLVPSEVRIRINVSKPYNIYTNPFDGYTPGINTQRNGGLPLYSFTTGEANVQTNVASAANEALDLIGVVPNPYYAHSGYETNRLDNRVKFINLPPRCTISIYNVSGTLVRKFRKDNELTYLDWDLNNTYNVPISGGTYICHIDVPNVGERVLKWFGVIRPVDLQNF